MNENDRLARLEARLAAAEARLAMLEQQLHRLPPPEPRYLGTLPVWHEPWTESVVTK